MPQTLAETLKDPRHRRIDDMLTHYPEVQDTLFSGQLGDGENVVLMPVVWRKSGYPVLERLLRNLKERFEAEERWPPYWHLKEWYFRCVSARKAAMRTDRRGRPTQAILNGEPQWRVERLRYLGVPDEVAEDGERQVRRGIEWLSEQWPGDARYQPETVTEIVKRLELARRKAA